MLTAPTAQTPMLKMLDDVAAQIMARGILDAVREIDEMDTPDDALRDAVVIQTKRLARS